MAIVLGTYQRQMTIDLENVAVANVLVTSSLKMLLWQRSGDIEFENVVVANVMCVSEILQTM